MEYIEREAAIQAAAIWNGDEGTEAWIQSALQKLPAADVHPVVRAAWQSSEQDKPPCKWYSCDYCGFHALSKSNFCPNCVAKMDGGSERDNEKRNNG